MSMEARTAFAKTYDLYTALKDSRGHVVAFGLTDGVVAVDQYGE